MFEEQIRDAQRIVLQQVVYAKKRDESHCPIPVYLYAGNTDNIVSRQSARSAFPMVEVLPGNHFTILDPDTPGSMTLPVLKGHILTALVAPPAMAPSGDPTSQTDLPSIQSRPDGAIGKQSSEASLSDFLISYQQSDRAWAEWIAWHLEAAGHTVVFQSGDFTPGTNWLQLMQNAVNRSARVIVIVSISYIGSMFRTDAWQHIWSQDPEGAQRRVIPVRVAECEPPELLAGIVGVDLFGITETQAIHRLHQAISHAFVGRAKPLASPNFPAPVALPGNAQAPAQTSSDPPTFPGRTYHINLQGAKGVQIGDGNTQMNQW